MKVVPEAGAEALPGPAKGGKHPPLRDGVEPGSANRLAIGSSSYGPCTHSDKKRKKKSNALSERVQKFLRWEFQRLSLQHQPQQQQASS